MTRSPTVGRLAAGSLVELHGSLAGELGPWPFKLRSWGQPGMGVERIARQRLEVEPEAEQEAGYRGPPLVWQIPSFWTSQVPTVLDQGETTCSNKSSYKNFLEKFVSSLSHGNQ